MSSVNKVIVIGNLGKDPEVRHAPSGTAIANITVATSRQWKNKESGEKMEETEWHRIVFYDRLAEIAGEFLQKGSKVYIEGRLKTRKWTDKEDIERYTTEIICDEMKMLSPRGEGGGQQEQQAPQQRQQPQRSSQGGNSAGGHSSPPAPAQRTQQRQAAPQRGGGTGFDNMDDDIQF